MATIAGIIGISDRAIFDALQARLKDMALEYRRVISMTPCDLPGAPSNHTLSERLDWVDAQLLNPITKLLEAIEPGNRHMLSLWPEEVVDELMPDFVEVTRQLQHLQKLGWHLAITIAKYRRFDLPLGPLVRSRIVAATAHIIEQIAPSFRPSRGTYDPVSKRFHGNYAEMIRLAFTEVTGLHEQLDRHIKEQVDQRRQ